MSDWLEWQISRCLVLVYKAIFPYILFYQQCCNPDNALSCPLSPTYKMTADWFLWVNNLCGLLSAWLIQGPQRLFNIAAQNAMILLSMRYPITIQITGIKSQWGNLLWATTQSPLKSDMLLLDVFHQIPVMKGSCENVIQLFNWSIFWYWNDSNKSYSMKDYRKQLLIQMFSLLGRGDVYLVLCGQEVPMMAVFQGDTGVHAPSLHISATHQPRVRTMKDDSILASKRLVILKQDGTHNVEQTWLCTHSHNTAWSPRFTQRLRFLGVSPCVLLLCQHGHWWVNGIYTLQRWKLKAADRASNR